MLRNPALLKNKTHDRWQTVGLGRIPGYCPMASVCRPGYSTHSPNVDQLLINRLMSPVIRSVCTGLKAATWSSVHMFYQVEVSALSDVRCKIHQMAFSAASSPQLFCRFLLGPVNDCLLCSVGLFLYILKRLKNSCVSQWK